MAEIETEMLELLREFQGDAMGILDEAEGLLCELQTQFEMESSYVPGEDRMHPIYRAFHSLKGNAGLVEQHAIVSLTHDAEALLDLYLKRRLRVVPDGISILIECCDLLRRILNGIGAGELDAEGRPVEGVPADPADAEGLGADAESFEDASAPTIPEFKVTEEIRAAFLVEAVEHLEIAEKGLMELEADPARDEVFLEVFREIHSLKGGAGMLGYAEGESLAHRLETALQSFDEVPPPLRAATLSGFLQDVDAIRKSIFMVAAVPVQASEPVDKPGPVPGAVQSREIRVDLAKLDVLLDLVGELVIANNMVVNCPDLKFRKSDIFERATHQLAGIVHELQNVAQAVRMIPVAGLFRKMVRLVHDVSKQAGKQVRLVTAGETTEVDKTVVEQIADPLVHILRNAIDHGIEPVAARVAAGKPARGKILLEARHDGAEVKLEVRDDGRGLDRERILARAVERGLTTEEDGARLSDPDVFQFVFLPGFSTAEAVTSISGRGVGMDVVKTNLDRLKGHVAIQSEKGRGTLVTLRIPLTLAIIEGMIVRVGSASFITPLLSIRELIRPEAADVKVIDRGLEVVRVRDTFFPVVRLHEIFKIAPEKDRLDQGVLVLVEDRSAIFALFVDEVLGQLQTVVKAIPANLGRIRRVSGCSIMANGDICLILDIHEIRKSVGHGISDLERAGFNGTTSGLLSAEAATATMTAATRS